MWNAVRCGSPSGVLVPEILDTGAAASTILNIEIAAAGVVGTTPGVRHQGAPALRESPLEFCFQGAVAGSADRQRIVQAGSDPRHRTISIDRGGWSSCGISVARAVAQPRIG